MPGAPASRSPYQARTGPALAPPVEPDRQRVRRLLAEGRLSERAIARVCGVSRGVVRGEARRAVANIGLGQVVIPPERT